MLCIFFSVFLMDVCELCCQVSTWPKVEERTIVLCVERFHHSSQVHWRIFVLSEHRIGLSAMFIRVRVTIFLGKSRLKSLPLRNTSLKSFLTQCNCKQDNRTEKSVVSFSLQLLSIYCKKISLAFAPLIWSSPPAGESPSDDQGRKDSFHSAAVLRIILKFRVWLKCELHLLLSLAT